MLTKLRNVKIRITTTTTTTTYMANSHLHETEGL
jgi:hypothetical protein